MPPRPCQNVHQWFAPPDLTVVGAVLGMVALGCGHVGIDLLDSTVSPLDGTDSVVVGTGGQPAGTSMDLGGASGVSGGQPGLGGASSTGGGGAGGLGSADGGQTSGTGAVGGVSASGGWTGRNGSGGWGGADARTSCRYGRPNTIGSCDTATCASSEVPGPSGACYFFSTTQTAQTQASSDCQTRGTGWDLTTVRSQEEHDFISSRLTVESWIGGSDATAPDTWAWGSGQPPFSQGGTAVNGAITFWAPGEPSGGVQGEMCIRYGRSSGDWLWYATACDQVAGAICEGPPQP